MDLRLWHPDPDCIVELRQLNSAITLLNKQIGQTDQQLEAFSSANHISKMVKKNLKALSNKLRKQKEILEEEMKRIGQKEYKQTLESLTSIPGIGPKTAIMLITLSADFTKFEDHKQLIAYIGFSP